MRLLISGATTTMESFARDPQLAPYLGVLLTPNTGNSIDRVVSWGLPFAADNAAFKAEQFETRRYLAMLEKVAQADRRPLFVVVPDQVGNHQCTRYLFDRWVRLLDTFQLPLAFVAQDGIEDVDDVPWDQIDALFIGGSDDFKDDIFTLCDLIPEAKRRGKHVHMGRVNGRRRLRLAVHSDCDSVDGTSLSWFANTYIPEFVRHVRNLIEEAAGLDQMNRQLEKQLMEMEKKTVILNYGMGVDSTVILHRWLTDPLSRDFDLSNLIVVSSQTGDEFPDTKRVVETHMLPLLREMQVRYVQLARGGPKEEDGIVVLSDTRKPHVLHTEGVWKLSDELTTAGTTPQVSNRRCSLKFKGWVIDSWLRHHLAGRPFQQAMGFNADERNRIERDSCYGADNRTAEYPLMTWNMGREAAEDYLVDVFGIAWPKSCCPFSDGKPDVLTRYRAMPAAAAHALLLEMVAMALNPNSHLYRDRSLKSVLIADRNVRAFCLLQEKLATLPWAVYRVRRIYTAKGHAHRSVEKVLVGTQETALDALQTKAVEQGKVVENGAGCSRFYAARRQPDLYPATEEMWVVAPALPDDKERPGFKQHWSRVVLAIA